MTVTPRCLDRLERRGGIESFDEHDGRARVQGQAEHHVHPEDVEHREDPEDDVTRLEASARLGLHLLEVGDQVSVGEHRRLRRPCRAAREQQRGEIVGAARH